MRSILHRFAEEDTSYMSQRTEDVRAHPTHFLHMFGFGT